MPVKHGPSNVCPLCNGKQQTLIGSAWWCPRCKGSGRRPEKIAVDTTKPEDETFKL